MKPIYFLYLALVFLIPGISSCSKDSPKDPIIPNEAEVITTLNFTLIPVVGGNPIVFTFEDLDGDGGDPPVMSGGALEANSSYTGTIELLNKLLIPIQDISEEVEKEAQNHQLFFYSTLNGLIINYDDQDTNGFPLGLKTTILTPEKGSGKLTITLRHQPNKSGLNVSLGDISHAGGETDIEITFDVAIQ